MQVDLHTHVLSISPDLDFMLEYGREVSLCAFRGDGRLPAHRPPTDDEWDDAGSSRDSWPVIGAKETLRDHPASTRWSCCRSHPKYSMGGLSGRWTPAASPTCRARPTRESATTT